MSISAAISLKTGIIALPARALISGLFVGTIVSICKLYMGLRLGFALNLSILAALLGFCCWCNPLSRRYSQPWTVLDSNILQTTSSAAGSTMAAGLVTAIPAYLILTQQSMAYLPTLGWMIAICLLGIGIAATLRPTLMHDPKLRFPIGLATANMIQELHNNQRSTKRKLLALGGAIFVAFGHRLVLPMGLKFPLGFAIPGKGVLAGSQISATNLGFVLEPSYMLLAFGTLIQWRTAVSLLLGSLIAWLGLAPIVVDMGWLPTGAANQSWFKILIDWLVWPGVALMLGAAVTSTIVKCLCYRSQGVKLRVRMQHAGLLLWVSPIIVLLQISLFDIHWFAACMAVPLAFIFTAVTAQVVGETGIPPIGALGKLSQLSFAVISPGQTATNIVTANVASGAAGQASDLLNDLKSGQLLQTPPRLQIQAQICGMVLGCGVSLAVFMLLIPDPANQLLTPEWPAPGVAAWTAIATALTQGLAALPTHAQHAAVVGALVGVLTELSNAFLSDKTRRWLPSIPAMGVAFVLPAGISLLLVIGATLAHLLSRLFPNWSQRYLIIIAAGFIAGESIAGVFGSLLDLLINSHTISR